MSQHAFRRAVLALLTLGIAACAGNDPASPRDDISVAPRLAPASASHDVLTPTDSALCRSGYSLAEGRVCP